MDYEVVSSQQRHEGKRMTNKCVYSECCVKFPNCPEGFGDSTEDYSCWEFEGSTEHDLRLWNRNKKTEEKL